MAQPPQSSSEQTEWKLVGRVTETEASVGLQAAMQEASKILYLCTVFNFS